LTSSVTITFSIRTLLNGVSYRITSLYLNSVGTDPLCDVKPVVPMATNYVQSSSSEVSRAAAKFQLQKPFAVACGFCF